MLPPFPSSRPTADSSVRLVVSIVEVVAASPMMIEPALPFPAVTRGANERAKLVHVEFWLLALHHM